MNSISKSIVILIITLNFFSCQRESIKNAVFNPPRSIQGTWVSPDPNHQFMRLTIKRSNFIEENLNDIYPVTPYINFNEKFDNNEFIITETIEPYSYTVVIKRKDGQLIDFNMSSVFYREYHIVYFNGQETLSLEYPGFNGSYLIRE